MVTSHILRRSVSHPSDIPQYAVAFAHLVHRRIAMSCVTPIVVLSNNHPQHKVHNNHRRQRNREHRRSEPIIESSPASRTLPDTNTTLIPYPVCAPVEHTQGIDHRSHGNECEEPCGDLADLVAEVEEADGETAEDDGEVEPGEEGSLVGEEDFGLDADGEGDAFAWRGGYVSMAYSILASSVLSL